METPKVKYVAPTVQVVYGEYPPNFDQIKAVFPMAGASTIFAYGDKIFVPSGNEIAPEILALVDQFRRNHTVLDDLLYAVEVYQKQVECAYALFETGFDPLPFRCGDDAGDQV